MADRVCIDCGGYARYLIEPDGEYDSGAYDPAACCPRCLPGQVDLLMDEVDGVRVSYSAPLQGGVAGG